MSHKEKPSSKLRPAVSLWTKHPQTTSTAPCAAEGIRGNRSPVVLLLLLLLLLSMLLLLLLPVPFPEMVMASA